jgi:hypothetical protein
MFTSTEANTLRWPFVSCKTKQQGYIHEWALVAPLAGLLMNVHISMPAVVSD